MTVTPFIRLTIIIYLMYSSLFVSRATGQDNVSYATRLGWQADDRVVIFHIDDAGMSCESNQGTVQALQFGIATSCSVMMPCPWVADITKHLRNNPEIDAGIHLTHTSEWNRYRWRSLSGIGQSPGLADDEGFLWNTVADVVSHAKLSEIEEEVKIQVASARRSGFKPTHMDTHMGTLWASPEYVNLYKRMSIQEHLPILLPGGHSTLLRQQLETGPLAGLSNLAPAGDNAKVLQSLSSTGETLWNAGLAVVDDLYILSYDWQLPSGIAPTDENLRKFKTAKYKRLLDEIKPGITVILIHCTDANKTFNPISDSWVTRRGDLLAMTDPELKDSIYRQGIVLTTWRELQQRREKLQK